MWACLAKAAFWIAGILGPQEMETRKPRAIILLPPPLLDVTEEEGGLTVRFRELGSERVVRYTVYRFREGKWVPIGSAAGSPMHLERCTKETSSYGIAAIDKSQTEGGKTRFTADLNCEKLKAARPEDLKTRPARVLRDFESGIDWRAGREKLDESRNRQESGRSGSVRNIYYSYRVAVGRTGARAPMYGGVPTQSITRGK